MPKALRLYVHDSLPSRVFPLRHRTKRLFASIAGRSRFPGLAEAVARLADVALTQAHDLLAAVAVASSWEAGPVAGVQIFHIAGGPRTTGATVGFVRLVAGGTFPEHLHLGSEAALVLQGALVDGDQVHRRGVVPNYVLHHQGSFCPVGMAPTVAGVVVTPAGIGRACMLAPAATFAAGVCAPGCLAAHRLHTRLDG